MADWFPIIGGKKIKVVPWGLMSRHERQARENHDGQTLQQLADRGGLHAREALCVLLDQRWPGRTLWTPEADIEDQLIYLVNHICFPQPVVVSAPHET